jgi:hypothetical protein
MQKSLFDFKQPERKQEAPAKQKSLFPDTPSPREQRRAEQRTQTRTEAPDTRRSSEKVWIPVVGETVILTNINDGAEGIVEFVDHPNLYRDYMFPIQCFLPNLCGGMMIREQLRDLKRKLLP